MHLYDTALGITTLLAIAVVMLPLAQKLRIPHTVLLTIVGCGLALLFKNLPFSDHGLSALLKPASTFSITAEAVFFIFLPILIFESALSIDARKLIDDIAPILLLAVLGLLLSTAMVGYVMEMFTPFPLLVCLLLGVIVSATDPVAVIAIFKEIGAPKRLGILVEGESLFNDATAIVLFSILAGMIASSQGEPVVDLGPALFSGVVDFFKVFLGGVLFGLACGWLFNRLMQYLGSVAMVRTTLTVCLAYFVFTVAEHHLHISGVMAVVVAALAMGTHMRTTMSSPDLHSMNEVWESLSFWANSLIFTLIGLTVPEIMAELGPNEWRWLLILLATGWLARLLIIYGLVPFAQGMGWIHRISFKFKTVMCFGGLRGAVSLALALTVYESDMYSDDVRIFIAMLVTGFVLSTLLINAPLMPFLIWLLRLDRLSAKDTLLRQRAVEHALGQVVERLGLADELLRVKPEISQEVIQTYKNRLNSQREQNAQSKMTLSNTEWMQTGLISLIEKERAVCFQLRNNDMVATEVMRHILRHLDTLEDGVKTDMENGYLQAVERLVSVDWTLKLGLYLQRQMGYSKLLADCLSMRYRVCFVMASVLEEVGKQASATLTPIITPKHQDVSLKLFNQRLNKVKKAFNNLELQYPDYALEIQRMFFERLSMHMERGRYVDLHTDGMISPELYKNLLGSVSKRTSKIYIPKNLRLNLQPLDLLKKVPFMLDFPPEVLEDIASRLKLLLTIPEEKIFSAGDTGDAMYFLTSGTVDVLLSGGVVSLGSGDFFGEMALMGGEMRNADVVSTAYCQMLVLQRESFDEALNQYPALRDKITAVASTRMSKDSSATPPQQGGLASAPEAPLQQDGFAPAPEAPLQQDGFAPAPEAPSQQDGFAPAPEAPPQQDGFAPAPEDPNQQRPQTPYAPDEEKT